MTLRSWAEATVDVLLATVGLYVAVYPGLSVAHALVTGSVLGAGLPATAALVVAVGGSYPFLAGDWSYGRLWRFVAGLVVATGAVSLLGLVALSRLDGPLVGTTVARALVLAVSYPVATVVAFRDRISVVPNPPGPSS